MRPGTVVQAVPHATTFVRGPALALAPHVHRLELHVRHNTLIEASRFLPGASRSQARFRWAALGARATWPANVEVRRLGMAYLRRDGTNPTVGPQFGQRLARNLEGRSDIALLHGHFLHPMGAAVTVAGQRLGLPTVVTGHGFDVYDLPERSAQWRALVLGVLDRADAVTTVSSRNAAILGGLGVPAHKLTIIPNGFDPARFAPQDQAAARRALAAHLQLPPRARLLLAVGNLVPIKGHRDLLDAVAPLLREHRDLVLALVGSGTEEAGLRRQANAAGIEAQVHFAGHRPHDEIPLWMNAADLYVLPSHAEGCVTVVQEALGCGLPVVATDVGQVPQVVGPQDGAIVVPRRPELLGKALASALERRFDRLAIAQRARTYTWDANAAATLAVYRRVCPDLDVPHAPDAG